MTYSAADTATIKALGKQQGISLAEAAKLVQFDMAKNPSHGLESVLNWFEANPESLSTRLNEYNQANPSAPIVPGRAQKIQYALIGAGVLLAVVVALVMWKKVLKK